MKRRKIQDSPCTPLTCILDVTQPVLRSPYLTWAFLEPSVIGGGGGGGSMRAPHHNFVVITPIIMKFGTIIKLDVFYTLVTKTFVLPLLLRKYDVIICSLADT